MSNLLQFFLTFLILFVLASSARAIVVEPSVEQLQQAIDKGKAAVQSKTPPSQLYSRFGSSEDLRSHGFIMTKLGGLAVLSAHYAFRSASPTQQDIARITKDSDLQISATVFGSSAGFAVDSYMVLKQGDRLIKPTKVRSDAQAHRSVAYPNDPPYKAKIVASFPYGSFDPLVPTTVSVFPGDGGEISFELDFFSIP